MNDISPYIVTVFNSKNCGSFLQGYALGIVIQRMIGTAPVYVETGARAGSTIAARPAEGFFRKFIRKGGPAGVIFALRRNEAYSSALAAYQVEPVKPEYGKRDLLVFGSDEIWNVSRTEMTNYPSLWGHGIAGGYKIAYAPSSNGANFENYSGIEEFKASLDSFRALSARDEYTVRCIEKITGRETASVCDPTLLLDVGEYRKVQKNTELHDYVLVYSYGIKMTDADIEEIKAFSKSRGLKLVSADQRLSWCDLCIPSGPYGFLGLMDKADYVITDTFHGTVFATIYGKRFASFARNNSKMSDFLKQVGLEKRNPAVCDSLEECLEDVVDYTSVHDNIDNLCKVSTSYLKKAIDDCMNVESDLNPSVTHSTFVPVRHGYCEISSNESLAKRTTFKMGGIAKKLYTPKKGDDLGVLQKDKNGHYLILSGGSNLLINDARHFDSVIYMGAYDNSITSLGGGRYYIGASARIQHIIKAANAEGYGGIEELFSIPGLLGGLICMNASVPSANVSISDYLESVEVYRDGNIETIPCSLCGFGYRKSSFQAADCIILAATFAFQPQDCEVSDGRIKTRLEKCELAQDRSAANFGSVFSKKDGKIMKAVQLLGLGFGKCSFSKKSGNWLLNKGGTFIDAICAIRKVEHYHALAGKECIREVVVWE